MAHRPLLEALAVHIPGGTAAAFSASSGAARRAADRAASGSSSAAMFAYLGSVCASDSALAAIRVSMGAATRRAARLSAVFLLESPSCPAPLLPPLDAADPRTPAARRLASAAAARPGADGGIVPSPTLRGPSSSYFWLHASEWVLAALAPNPAVAASGIDITGYPRPTGTLLAPTSASDLVTLPALFLSTAAAARVAAKISCYASSGLPFGAEVFDATPILASCHRVGVLVTLDAASRFTTKILICHATSTLFDSFGGEVGQATLIPTFSCAPIGVLQLLDPDASDFDGVLATMSPVSLSTNFLAVRRTCFIRVHPSHRFGCSVTRCSISASSGSSAFSSSANCEETTALPHHVDVDYLINLMNTMTLDTDDEVKFKEAFFKRFKTFRHAVEVGQFLKYQRYGYDEWRFILKEIYIKLGPVKDALDLQVKQDLECRERAKDYYEENPVVALVDAKLNNVLKGQEALGEAVQQLVKVSNKKPGWGTITVFGRTFDVAKFLGVLSFFRF